jgi:ubiquinone/menaquinone biosynthesis C-methylase UbiE
MIGMKTKFVDHFNQQSTEYSLCRPDYPDSLFDYLAGLVDGNSTVWDCGAGSGQATKALAERFKRVIATDVNQKQLDAAPKFANVDYRCCKAEQTTIPDNSIHLTTIAQALHWFDFPRFYEEVRRVSTPNALIAAWCYSLASFNNGMIDAVVHTLYYELLGKEFWPKERCYVDEEYATIPFPFSKQPSPTLFIEKNINFEQFIGYLLTWSAVKEYQHRTHNNPIDLIYLKLAQAWGEPQQERAIHWPLHCIIGKVL